jgi:hypothetical protein
MATIACSMLPEGGWFQQPFVFPSKILPEGRDQQSNPASQNFTNTRDFARLRGVRFSAVSFVEHDSRANRSLIQFVSTEPIFAGSKITPIVDKKK